RRTLAHCALYELEMPLMALIEVTFAPSVVPGCTAEIASCVGDLDFDRTRPGRSLCQAIASIPRLLPGDRPSRGCDRGAAGCGAVARARARPPDAVLHPYVARVR